MHLCATHLGCFTISFASDSFQSCLVTFLSCLYFYFFQERQLVFGINETNTSSNKIKNKFYLVEQKNKVYLPDIKDKQLKEIHFTRWEGWGTSIRKRNVNDKIYSVPMKFACKPIHGGKQVQLYQYTNPGSCRTATPGFRPKLNY